MKRSLMALLITTVVITGELKLHAQGNKQKKTDDFSQLLMADKCDFSTTGKNDYFILEPGYQLILEGKAGKSNSRLVITVLNKTKNVGGIETRVVEENETVDGKTIEISRNFFSFCKQTSSIYYFGEEVDIYKNGKIVGHDGAWLAEGKNKPGIAIPGKVNIVSKFYHELAPGVAMDRVEIKSLSETKQTPAGKFANVLKTEETTPLDAKEKEYKLFAPGVGLIMDEGLLLVKYGYVKL